jgi:isopenicillin N synthase-like dioxygenase
MASNTLPIIDIAPFLNTNNADARAAVSAALHSACLKFGFFYLDLSSYINESEPEKLVNLGREFFALPQEQKETISLRHQDYARGLLLTRSGASARSM